MKRLLLTVLAVGLWTAVTAYGAIDGWWLEPIAPKGDTRAFMDAAIAMSNAQSRGNVALVLMHNGEVYHEHFVRSVDRIDRNTRFPLASMSKWFTGYAVMRLVQDGKIDLDAPIATYLKQWQLPTGQYDNSRVTVRRLLSHTAGLTDGLGFDDYAPTELLPSVSQSLRNPRASSGTDAVIAVGREPGSGFLYSGGGYLILQAIIEDVTGMPFAQWVQQSVFQPLGMRRATYEYLGNLDNVSKSYDTTGAPAPTFKYAAAAATGMSASTSDLVAFARAQWTADRDGTPLLSRANVDRMREPNAQTFGLDIWGLGVSLYAPTSSGAYVFGHDGANAPAINTSMRVNPDTRDALIVLVNGNPALASSIGYEWTLWQTGVADFLTVEKAARSAVSPLLIGYVLIAATALLLWLGQRRSTRATTT